MRLCRCLVLLVLLFSAAACGTDRTTATTTSPPPEEPCSLYAEFVQLVWSFADLGQSSATWDAAERAIEYTSGPMKAAAGDLAIRAFSLDRDDPTTALLRSAIDEFIHQVSNAEADYMSWVQATQSVASELGQGRPFIWPEPGFQDAVQLSAFGRQCSTGS